MEPVSWTCFWRRVYFCGFVYFVQDFGDYADSYYAVQTLEGEQIAQLISGYIDIILKKVSHLAWRAILLGRPIDRIVYHMLSAAYVYCG